MRERIRTLLSVFRRAPKAAPPPPRDDTAAISQAALDQLAISRVRESTEADRYWERVGELVEAAHMAGAGPWRVSRATLDQTNVLIERAVRAYESRAGVRLTEDATEVPLSVGAYGDIELALQNVEWRRQINLSWMEFSRWGIQQIILICRLYWLKNPIIRRLVNVGAAYVFARGVEVSTNDEAANEVWEEFLARNRGTFGHVALTNAERAKDTDGNLFWVFFPDAANTGRVSCRTVEATEISQIVCDPNDSDTPRLYKREWDQEFFDSATGAARTEHQTAWYPALGYEPAAGEKPETIGTYPVHWDTPIYHRREGTVGKWRFGCPKIYPALDWAREARRFLEACASIRQSLSQIAMTFTTKGGQQAIDSAKQQMATTIGPSSSPWDQNPPAGRGSTFVSGPGTKLEAFKVQGSGFSPEDVRQYKLMCAMVVGVPETFLGDVQTGNLATATSLDRPTETVFLERQEAWIEDLTVIATYVLRVSARAPSGRIRESAAGTVPSIEACPRRIKDGRRVYEAFAPSESGKIQVRVAFPAIREGDIPALVASTVKAMTLDSRGGQVVGIDEKEGVRLLYQQLGIENGDELVEAMYPDSEYEADRSVQEIPPPIPKTNPGGVPQFGAPPEAEPNLTTEALRQAAARLLRAVDAVEARRGGNGCG